MNPEQPTQPTPEDEQKAKEMMSKEEQARSSLRSSAYEELTSEQKEILEESTTIFIAIKGILS